MKSANAEIFSSLLLRIYEEIMLKSLGYISRMGICTISIYLSFRVLLMFFLIMPI